MPIMPQIASALDDVSPQSGVVNYGQYTNDTAPVLRISLGDQAAAGQSLTLTDNNTAIGAAVTLTAAQVAQGYVEVPVSGLPEGWNLFAATLTDTGGTAVASSAYFALGVATTAPVSPTIVEVDEDVGGTPHALANGAHTADATLVLHLFETGLPPTPTAPPGHAPYGGPAMFGGHIQLFEDGHLVGDAVVSYDGTVSIAPDALAPGQHTLVAVALDRAGNASAASAPFQLTIDSAPALPGSTQGTDGDDVLQASAGSPIAEGGAGNDTISGGDFSDLLRGGEGNDSIVGGTHIDIINGNQGADTILGRATVGDLLLGGQGADVIDAGQSTGHNIVNGNLGADTISGGSGGDILLGGQGADVIVGGASADFISGDRGANTLTGGGGGDFFHAGAGLDVVTDFSQAQGDRVVVDPGAHFTAAQVGQDTVISIVGGGQMTLVGVQYASLTGDWILQP
jgi:Ca2+-binding RTX toxin-like protein